MENSVKVYIIRNRLSNKIYVGISCDPVRRWWTHRSEARNPNGSSTYLYVSMRKYGVDAFEMFVIDEASHFADAALLEIKYIAMFKEMGRLLYNCTDGGDGPVDYVGKPIGSISTSVKDALARKKAKGEKLGGRCKFGYRPVGKGVEKNSHYWIREWILQKRENKMTLFAIVDAAEEMGMDGITYSIVQRVCKEGP